MVEEMVAARGVEVTYETVRRWSVKFGLGIARRIRSTAMARGDKWHLDEVVIAINGRKHWLWRAVDQHGAVLDVLVQSRRDKHAAERLMRKLLKRHGRTPRGYCQLVGRGTSSFVTRIIAQSQEARKAIIGAQLALSQAAKAWTRASRLA